MRKIARIKNRLLQSNQFHEKIAKVYFCSNKTYHGSLNESWTNAIYSNSKFP